MGRGPGGGGPGYGPEGGYGQDSPGQGPEGGYGQEAGYGQEGGYGQESGYGQGQDGPGYGSGRPGYGPGGGPAGPGGGPAGPPPGMTPHGMPPPPVSGAPGGQPPGAGLDPAVSGDVQRVDQLRRTFQPRRFGSGYDRQQVDRLFEEVLVGMSGRGPVAVSEAELDPKRFDLVPGGYFEAEVDAALHEVRDIIRRH